MLAGCNREEGIRVQTLAGIGAKGSDYKGGGKGSWQVLNSPWDVYFEPVNEIVYIAMDGPHQIWEHNTSTGVTRVLACETKPDPSIFLACNLKMEHMKERSLHSKESAWSMSKSQLLQVEIPEDLQRDTTEDGVQGWYYPSHDFTLMIIWTRFLVMGDERIHNGTASGIFDIHVDRVDMNWASKLEGLDYIIISSDLWTFKKIYLYEGGKVAGCVSCSDPNLEDPGIVYSIQRALRTSLQHISRCTKCDRLLTIWRTLELCVWSQLS